MVVVGVAPDRATWSSAAPGLRVRVGDRVVHDGPATAVVVASGQYLRGADVVPRGHPGDGRAEIQVYAVKRGERAGVRSRLPQGVHLPHPDITQGERAHGRDPGRPGPPPARGRRRDPPPGGVGDRRGAPGRVRPGALNPRPSHRRGCPTGRVIAPIPSPTLAARPARWRRDCGRVPLGEVHRRRGGRPPAVLHQSRSSGLRAGQPPRGREGRPVRRATRARTRACAASSSTSSSTTSTSPATSPSTRPSACAAPKSSTTASSSSTATTRSRSSVACTSRASSRRTCSPRSSSGVG